MPPLPRLGLPSNVHAPSQGAALLETPSSRLMRPRSLPPKCPCWRYAASATSLARALRIHQNRVPESRYPNKQAPGNLVVRGPDGVMRVIPYVRQAPSGSVTVSSSKGLLSHYASMSASLMPTDSSGSKPRPTVHSQQSHRSNEHPQNIQQEQGR